MPRPWTGKYVHSVLLLLIIFEFNGVLNLPCLKAEYQIGQECCPKCPPGNRVNKHCTEFRSTSCLPCDDGTFMDQLTGQITCFPCTRCDPGSGLKVKRSCTSLLDTVCEPQEGYFCIDPKDDSCVRAQKHKKCDQGQYIKVKGTSSADTGCSHCTDGTFSDGTFTQCRPHTQCESLNQQLVNPGTSSTDAECEEQRKGLPIGAIVVGILLPIFLIVAGAAGFYFCHWRKIKKNIITKERRGEAGFPAEISREEAIALNPENIPNIRAVEVHSTEETKRTA